VHPEIQMILKNRADSLAALCSDLSVKRLGMFGSACGIAFDPTNSDVDFLVDFKDADRPGIADRYFSLVEGLEGIFERPADVITRRSIRNPVFRRVADKTETLLYEG
jgi:predicted nucleotidyltransferase